ncbi:N-formylglutamate amidohydrolase [Fulvimarina endophytica]|uniref:N-formylglutamate amidohydrolase n=1 Tax=Fulvimarina endophytica TaxID=2293836 RepID=A0A371X512_9HYPH|nr:N-formylglutamate amidohydrolase [Fulvimarina endophytica]RFC64315.1 N-formylglutamate amidohydrolase [Fulvimarina endophytica]
MVSVPTITTAEGERPAFLVTRPDSLRTPLVFCSPHSGRHYPLSFVEGSRLSTDLIRRSEDLFVDELYRFVGEIGAPMIAASFPRAFLDVNREPYELDPQMFTGDLPEHANTRSARVAGGLGVIPRIVAENTEIYRERLTAAEGLARIETYHLSFHEALEGLIAETKRVHGMAILVDCHSMPSTVRPAQGGRRPDVIIGDRYGTSAAAGLVTLLTSAFSRQGYGVARNKPYAGGYITERYGRPAIAEHALQVELCRGLYADERSFTKSEGFDRLAADLRAVFVSLAEGVRQYYSRAIAAE